MVKTKNREHSLVAYNCRIKYKERNNSFREMFKEEIARKEDPKYTFPELMSDFCSYFLNEKKALKSSKSDRVININEECKINSLNENISEYYLSLDAGKGDIEFAVVNNDDTNKKNKFGKNESALYPHNVFFYFNNKTNDIIAIFHHYGNSACKTAFFNCVNKFLEDRGLYFVMDVVICNEVTDEYADNAEPMKVNLVRKYNEIPEDKADHKKTKTKEFVDCEISLNLTSPRLLNVKKMYHDAVINKSMRKEATEQVLSSFNLDNFDYDEAKLVVNIGGIKKTIGLSTFSDLIGEHYITKELTYDIDGNMVFDSLVEASRNYFLKVEKFNIKGEKDD